MTLTSSRVRDILIMLAACNVLATPVLAQEGYSAGLRAGISGQPDQVFVGAQLDSPNLGHACTFRPNVEIGFGGNSSRFGTDTVLLAVNLELVHWMPLPKTSWKFYAGGGVGANFLHSDFEGAGGFRGGLNAAFGLQDEHGVFVEIKTGIEPRGKVMIGYMLKH